MRVARKIDRYSEYGAAVLLLLVAGFALVRTRTRMRSRTETNAAIFARWHTGWLAYGKWPDMHRTTLLSLSILSRYAIGNAERPTLERKIGWLDHLANTTYQFYRKWIPFRSLALKVVCIPLV